MTRTLRQPSYDVVVPTIGRESLTALLDSLAKAEGPLPERVIVVDDRRDPIRPLLPSMPAALRSRIKVVTGPKRGPAAARNVGWRAASAEWVAFLDDDVVLGPRWRADLVDDVSGLGPGVVATQGRIQVPLPSDRKPTDWERNVAGLESAKWATADMAYRRLALEAVGGFDERFPRAYREDIDLALRVVNAGWDLAVGRRVTTHPVRAADRWVSIRLQAGNADDALMDALHGRGWQERAGIPRGRRAWHLATAAMSLTALVAAVAGRRRLAFAALSGWLLTTGRFALERIKPGPRTGSEIATMAATSVAIPLAASYHWLAGRTRARGALPRSPARRRPAAVLFDRDGTLVHDVPYNGDPAKVRPVDGARESLERLRNEGIPVAVVSNQSGVARGLISLDHVDAVNRRIEDLLGPFDAWLVCPHGPDDGCECRKPSPGMVVAAAARLGVAPHDCALVGDIGSDIEAALSAGARGVLVPTAVTRAEEIEAAPEVASSLRAAVDLLLDAPSLAVLEPTDDVRRSA